MRKSPIRMGRAIKAAVLFWKNWAREKGNNPVSPLKLKKAGCSVSHAQLQAILPKLARNGIAKKLSRGTYVLKNFRSTSRKHSKLVIGPKMSSEEAKLRIESRIQQLEAELNKLKKLHDSLSRCPELFEVFEDLKELL